MIEPTSNSSGGRISRFSLDRRVTVLVLFLTALVVGVASAIRIPMELIPRGFENPSLRVSIPWSDAPAREVLDKLSIPLEEELSTVRGIDTVFSVSVTGRSLAFMRFKHGTDMDVAYREVRDRVERARTQFPDDVDRIFIQKEDASGIPVCVLGCAVDPAVTDSYNLVQNEVIKPLSRIDGVASVQANGLLEKEILIELDREKTASAGLNIFELAQELGTDNFTMASGRVMEGSKKLLLRSVARFRNLEELENRRVGASVRLKDIATISYAQPEAKFRVRAMSKPAVAILVMKEGEANVREVSAAVAAQIEKLQENPRLSSSVELVTLFSQGEVIDEALTTLLSSGMVGGIIAIIVLFVFLRRFRLTLIIALGIPLSLLIGLIFMDFGGETLNLLTLLGLMLCVGLLVDNSVVVAENIHRLHREGMGRREACITGASEVALAITMSTLTTIVVFLPVSLVEGPGQFFMLRLSIPVCISVFGSLLVALVFIPICVYLTLPSGGANPRSRLMGPAREKISSGLRLFYDATFERLNQRYSRILSFFMARRFDLVLGLAIIFSITAAVAMQKVEFVESQKEEARGFFIGVEMPPSTSLEETESWFLKAEKVVEDQKEELGLEGWFVFHRKTSGEVQGWFTRPKSTEYSVAEVTKKIQDALPKKPGMKLTIGNDRDTSEEKASEFLLVLNGEDADALEEVSLDIERLLVQVDGVVGLKGASQQPPNELGLAIDRDRAQHFGVNPQAVAGVVGYALRGAQLPKYHQDGREIPVRVRFQEEDRESLSELDNFLVPTNSGAMLPLSALTQVEFVKTPSAIVRRNKKISRVITLELQEENATQTRKKLSGMIAGIDLPEGISFGRSSRNDRLDEDLAGMLFALTLSIVFIYLLMGFLFESFILPLSIIFTIPLSILGVYWIHFCTGYNLDFLGVVAVVLLVGVVVNNGIVLIDMVNRLRARGDDRLTAILTATRLRFRPIMMTAITTVGGMIPLAFAGSSRIGLSYTSFSLTLIGGMTTATLLTLLVVPVFYTFFDDLRGLSAAAVKKALQSTQGGEGENVAKTQSAG